jgi:hypothetical protein
MSRRTLPPRRISHNLTLVHDGTKGSLTFSRFDEDGLAELFVDYGAPGSDARAFARDGGILISMLLQHGIPPTEIVGSLTHDDAGRPATPLGKALASAIGMCV